MSSLPTTGLEVQRGSRAWRDTLELVSSMRFSISLLTVICIASMIGTVVRQHEPLPNYVNQFGPFWADVFGRAGLYEVYSAPWFLLILTFLVVSTSLCIDVSSSSRGRVVAGSSRRGAFKPGARNRMVGWSIQTSAR